MAEDNTENRPRIQAGAASAAVPRPFGVSLPIGWPEFGFSAALGRLLIREVEQRQLFVWLPVCFGLGVVLFFQAEGEPALWAPVAGCGLFTALGIAFRARLAAMAALFGLAAVFAGFAAGAVRT